MKADPGSAAPRGEIDTTMMYAAHHAFRRELTRLTVAAPDDPAAASMWLTFKNYLHIHHTAEDDALWPILRRRLADHPEDLALLDAMEAEHAAIDPLLRKVDDALSQHDGGLLRAHLGDLAASVTAHLAHEEAEVMPLVHAVLTQSDWDTFGEAHRRQVGIRGAASFFPWLLDEAPQAMRDRVLALLPLPVRLVYWAVWRPRYLRRA